MSENASTRKRKPALRPMALTTEEQCVLKGQLQAALAIIRNVDVQTRDLRKLGTEAPDLSESALQATNQLLRMIHALTPGATRKVAA